MMIGKSWFVSLVVLMLSASLAGGCGGKPSKKPELSTISPVSGSSGTKVTIIGANMGDTQGDSVVHFGNKVPSALAWSDTAIAVNVPNGLSQRMSRM